MCVCRNLFGLKTDRNLNVKNLTRVTKGLRQTRLGCKIFADKLWSEGVCYRCMRHVLRESSIEEIKPPK